jgi:hypothetical protein
MKQPIRVGLEGGRDVVYLMTLLVHLGVLSVGRLGVTAIVTIGTVVGAVWGRILSHVLRQTRTLGAVLWSSIVARGRRLVPNGRQLRVRRTLSRHTDSLSHLPVDRSFARRASFVTAALLNVGSMTLVICLALSLFLLLLGFPLFTNLLEFYVKVKLVCDNV